MFGAPDQALGKAAITVRAATRCPTLKPVTSAPIASTTPAIS